MAIRLALALVTAATLAAGCAGAPGGTATPVAPTESTPAQATATPGLPVPTRPSMDPELERLLPDRVGTLEISKSSLSGLQFASDAAPEFEQFMRDVGVSGTDISVASGFGMTADRPPTSLVMLAIRVRGADEQALQSTFRRALEESGEEPYTITATQLGGREVLAATRGEVGDPPAYFYATGDLIVFVAASDAGLAGQAIALLP